MTGRTTRWLAVALMVIAMAPCQRQESVGPAAADADEATSPTALAADLLTSGTEGLNVPKASLATLADPEYRARREAMVPSQIGPGRMFDWRQPVRDPRVLAAMRLVPRHEFVPRRSRPGAYADTPLRIGYGQTISQPYIVALMTELLKTKPDHRVLEIGTGSGYQAAVLAVVVKDVYTIEIVEPLAERATKDLKRLGYTNVHVRAGDGYRGWPEHAPFDGVIVTAAPERIPEPLIEQLKVGGRLVIPVGPQLSQELVVIRKTAEGTDRERVIPVRFVPMVGEVEEKSR
jgi:protein-L-isoaspartate(D-aspartate) O-methyltransferase